MFDAKESLPSTFVHFHRVGGLRLVKSTESNAAAALPSQTPKTVFLCFYWALLFGAQKSACLYQFFVFLSRLTLKWTLFVQFVQLNERLGNASKLV